MKVGIITVYYTENCGSILQATALSKKLTSYGCEVVFISTRNKYSGHSINRTIKNCIKSLIQGKGINSSIRKYKDYENYIRMNFKTISNKEFSNLDLIIIGSDTVWDINSLYFMESQNLFWSLDSKNVPVVSYAASIANSSYQKLDSLKYPIIALNTYKDISVRDSYTKQYIESRTSKNVELVCDPTLLFDQDCYKRMCKSVKEKNYLLLYLFDEPNSKIADEIKEFAQSNGLKIICIIGMGKSISIADIYIESSIENFLSYFNKATYVLTNTFHGTVFSTIFNRNFIVLDYNKNKILEYLTLVGLESRLCSNQIALVYSQNIDYTKVNAIILNLRRNAEKYLENILDENKHNDS